jgi:hypothetical protein
LTLRLKSDKSVRPAAKKACHRRPFLAKNEQSKYPVKKSQTRHFKKSLAALACLCVFAASFAWATASVEASYDGHGAAQAGLRAIEPVGSQIAGSGPSVFQATLFPIPVMSVLFPIIGLIAAVAVTQLLRRRRIAQLRSSSSTGQ